MHLKEQNITGEKLEHTIHTEDLIYNGVEGINFLIKALYDTFNALRGSTQRQMKATVKVDGAPSVVCASDVHGRYFVAKKGALVAKNPKVAFTPEDCDLYFESPDLAFKMKQLLRWAPVLGIPKDQMWQGDFLFTHNDLKKVTIDNTEYITFHPNTIVYAVPLSDQLAQKILKADLGICWHTKYDVDASDNLKMSFDVNVNQLQSIPSVFQIDANMPNLAGKLTLTEQESNWVESELAVIKNKLSNIANNALYNTLLQDTTVVGYLNSYENFTIKTRSVQKTSELSFDDFLNNYIIPRYDAKIASYKSDKYRVAGEAKKHAMIKILTDLKPLIVSIWDVQNLIVDVKELLIKKLDTVSSMKSFVKDIERGYIPCSNEGYVVSDVDGNVQKLVSRLEFSKNNFSQNIVKGWTNDRRDKEQAKYVEATSNIITKVDAIVDPVLDKAGVELKKATSNFNGAVPGQDGVVKGRHYIVMSKETPFESRDIKAGKVEQELEADPSASEVQGFKGGDNGTTPTVTALLDADSDSVADTPLKIELKPRPGKELSDAESTEADEVYWAYCMSLINSHQEQNLATSAEDAADTDLRFLGLKETQHPKAINWEKGYIESSKTFCNTYLEDGADYIFCRENTVISHGQLQQIPSIHTLLNTTIKQVYEMAVSKDSWNPADIVVCRESFYNEFIKNWNLLKKNLLANKDMHIDEKVAQLNGMLLQEFLNKNIICVSLKDIYPSGKVILKPQNITEDIEDSTIAAENKNMILDSIDLPVMLPITEMEAMHPELLATTLKTGLKINAHNDFRDVIITYRNSSGTSTAIESAERSSTARDGKMPKILLKELYDKYSDENVQKERNAAESAEALYKNPDLMSRNIIYILNSFLESEHILRYINIEGSDLSIENWKRYAAKCNELRLQRNDRLLNRGTAADNGKDRDEIVALIWPRILDFLYMLALNQNNISEILERILNGAAKTYKGCAPFIKIFSK